MTTRAITFPKAGDDTWTNSETGIQITRDLVDGGIRYVVRAADGMKLASKTRLIAAIAVGKDFGEVVRGQIADAYDEALAEHVARAELAAKAVDAPTWRARAAKRMLGYGDMPADSATDRTFWRTGVLAYVRRQEEITTEVRSRRGGTEAGAREQTAEQPPAEDVNLSGIKAFDSLCLRADGPHIPHMAAISPECRDVNESVIDPDVEGTCTAVIYGLPHAFEYDPAEVKASITGNDGYDEYERCGRYRSDSVHTVEAGEEAEGARVLAKRWADVTEASGGLHPEDRVELTPLGAEAVASGPRFPKGTPEYEAYRKELTAELGKFACGEDPYPYVKSPSPESGAGESSAEDLIHHWDGTRAPSDCGVDVFTTPYTFGSPAWTDVTCGACLPHRPADDTKTPAEMVAAGEARPFMWADDAGSMTFSAAEVRILKAAVARLSSETLARKGIGQGEADALWKRLRSAGR